MAVVAAKQPKTAAYSEEKDRLSNLTDDLICHILSFLPTEVAYRTSVLSTRWKSLCTKVPDLDFKLPPSSQSYCSVRIRSIYSVNSVLFKRTQKIRKLSLHSRGGCQPCDVYVWLMKALDLSVEELSLDLDLLLRETSFILPPRVSTSESLVVLKLCGGVQPAFASSVYLPSLKILHFEVTHCQHSLSAFLSGCPGVEELRLHGLLKFKVPLDISLNFLKRLCLNFITCTSVIQINVPSIEVLEISDNCLPKLKIVSLFNVDRATLRIRERSDFDGLYRLLERFSNVKSLSLETFASNGFLSKDNLENLSVFKFHNLLHLWVQISEDCSWDMIVGFLQNAPILEALVIEKNFKRNLERSTVGNPGWTGPTIIPMCLSTSLKRLEFRGIQNSIKAELDFTRYIIENSSKLEKVKIFTRKSKQSKASALVERNLFKGKKKSSVFTWDIYSF